MKEQEQEFANTFKNAYISANSSLERTFKRICGLGFSDFFQISWLQNKNTKFISKLNYRDLLKT